MRGTSVPHSFSPRGEGGPKGRMRGREAHMVSPLSCLRHPPHPAAATFSPEGEGAWSSVFFHRWWPCRLQTAHQGDENHPAPPASPRNRAVFSPPREPAPTISPSRRGYTARRGSEAGSARGVRGGRKTSRTGSAENGLPPVIRGKRRGVGPNLPLRPDNAGRACAAHNMAAAPCGVRGSEPGSHGAVEDGADRQSWLRHRRSEGVHDPFPGRACHRSHAPRHRRETGVAGKNRRTGRRKVSFLNISDAAPPAPRPNQPANHGRNPPRGRRRTPPTH